MVDLPMCCLFWFILSTLFVNANAADASIQAPDKIILGTTTLDITCSVTSASSLKRIYSLSLLRNNSNTASVLTNIGFIDSDVDGATIKNDADLQSRASISGTVASPSTAQLKLSVSASKTKCTDAVSYQCKVAALNSADNTETYTKDKDIKVEVRPSSTADIVVRSGSSSISDSKPYKYTPGTVVTLTCKGSVGNPAKLHRWCKKGVNDQTFTGYPNSAHINQEVSLVYQPATCDYHRTSSLTYTITTQDTKIEFLCEDGTNSLCGDGLFTKQVEIENIIADVTKQTPTEGRDKDAEQPNTISVVLISVATVLFVICAVYAAWNVFNKRRLKGVQEKSQTLATVSGNNIDSSSGYVNAGEASYDYIQNDIERTGTEMIDRETKRNDYQTLGNRDRPNVYQSLVFSSRDGEGSFHKQGESRSN